MSAVPCPMCGNLRKIEQVSTPDGWENPRCWSCGDPGWTQPYGVDDPLGGRTPEAQREWIRFQREMGYR